MAERKSVGTPTQEHLPIAGIQDGVVIMNDSSVRAILKVEPINFELKSETEQNGIIYAYQAFLNSLDFSVQFVIHSKKLDLENYLLRLEKSEKGITNDLLRIQTEDYIDFVRRLISLANIMSKRFYAVVSYASVGASSKNSMSSLFHNKASTSLLDQEQFARYRTEVYSRANMIAAGLGNIGLKVNLLDTQKLIELFYTIYNPDIATEEKLSTAIENVESDLITTQDNVSQNMEEVTEARKEQQPVVPGAELPTEPTEVVEPAELAPAAAPAEIPAPAPAPAPAPESAPEPPPAPKPSA